MPSSATEPVLRAARSALLQCAPGGTAAPKRIAVALSGGRDSMVLLDALATLAPGSSCLLTAVHVHHGLSPNADAWMDFCAEECAKRGVPLAVHRVHVDRTRGTGLEAAARAARYAVFAAAAADFVAIAHHADDQAETLLLQLLRGSGPPGLAAMATLRTPPAGPVLLRPFLSLPRAAIDAYAATRAIAWIDDESNADTARARNLVRREIAPRLAAAFDGYPATLARAAMHQAEAARLLDELAAIDAEAALAIDGSAGTTLDRNAFAALAERAPHRARNLLRWFVRRHRLRAPSAARLAAMQNQLAHAANDARVRIAHDGAELGFHRGRIVVHTAAVAAFEVRWCGETALALPHGVLEFAPVPGFGLDAAAATRGAIVIRARSGGEKIRLSGDRPRQTLKRLLQVAGVPHWQRDALPFVWCGELLAAVPGIGVDIAFAAAAGAPGYDLHWRPDPIHP
jgi:tRNA(Ile)-lysidine synthase